MEMVEIDIHSPARDPAFTFWERAMYDLLGSNMTAILGHDGPDWRVDDEFRKWEKDILLDGLRKGAIHLLLADDQGLRGFLSFTAPPSSTEIYVNEIQIRQSARKDGVTFRRLIQRFASRIADLPQASIRTYANRRNMDSQKLIQKAGFSLQSQTERGARFVASKAVVLAKFRSSGFTVGKNGFIQNGHREKAEITIREPTPGDAERLAALLCDDIILRRDLGLQPDDRPKGPDFLQKLSDWSLPRRATTFAILVNDVAIGTISLSHRSQDGLSAKIGYWVGSRYRRQDYGKQAFAAVLARGEVEGIMSLSATIASDNVASRRIWEQQGASVSETTQGRLRYDLAISSQPKPGKQDRR